MINICGDSMNRRDLLRVGGLSTLGLTLPQLLAGEASADAPRSRTRVRARSCLLFYLEGGPSHVDLWDMKPNAPAEIRGIFQPIRTRVPGLHVCEHLPRLSQQIHRLTLVRSVTHGITDHNAGTYQALTGRDPRTGSGLIQADEPGNFPPYGSVIAKLRPSPGNLPSFVHIPEVMSNLNVDIAGQSAGFLGSRYDPFVTGDPSLPNYRVPGLAPSHDLTPSRLATRGRLLQTIDRGLGQLGDDRSMQRMSGFYQRAMSMITSPRARRAFDLSQEPQSVRERYGIDPGSNRAIEARRFGGLPHLGQCMLLARRLIEADVRLVTVVSGRRIDQAWDTHRSHFGLLQRSLCPMFDRSFSALLEDMALRGLLEDTLIVVMGEFGRTPKLGYVTSGAGAESDGRDHWPYCYTVMFGGAGVPGGALYGSSDRIGGYPSSDPVSPADITATIYEAMGVPGDTEIRDTLDRPHYLVTGRAIRPIVGA